MYGICIQFIIVEIALQQVLQREGSVDDTGGCLTAHAYMSGGLLHLK